MKYLKIENPKNIPTTGEIESLYEGAKIDYLGLRDRAILSLIYGCGLKVKEVVKLNVSDVYFTEDFISINKSKIANIRLVAMADIVKKDLNNYIYFSRLNLISNRNEKALLVDKKGNRINKLQLKNWLHKLIKRSEISSSKKVITLENLSNSISVHMLQKGFKLNDIERHLGYPISTLK